MTQAHGPRRTPSWSPHTSPRAFRCNSMAAYLAASGIKHPGRTTWPDTSCFCFSSRSRHTRYWRDWSSDVCSSDLEFFTDPHFGLPKFFDDSRKELPFSGVYCLINGELKLVSTDLTGPNGLAFSPDEKYLYVDDWDDKKKIILRYDVQRDGSLANKSTFLDATSEPGEDAWDGLKVDRQGNVYASGPGGLWIISPEGKHLGTLVGPEHPHNLAWGGEDHKTLYLAAQTGLYRVSVNIPGAGQPQ